jgi:hypothetical protein
MSDKAVTRVTDPEYTVDDRTVQSKIIDHERVSR